MSDYPMVYLVENKADGLSGRVFSNGVLWITRLHDDDADQTLPVAYHFATEDEAKRKANGLAFGLNK